MADPNRLITAKQTSYMLSLRRRLVSIFGSQTPREFLDYKNDESLTVLRASVLIGQMKKMLEEGTPPVREEAPKSAGSGYDSEPSPEDQEERARRLAYNAAQQAQFEGELERDFPLDGRNVIRVWKRYPNFEQVERRYWSRGLRYGWTWICFDSSHRSPVEGGRNSHPRALLAAMAHWKKFHKPKE